MSERQYVAVKFRTEDKRSYTYHNDGEPVGAGQQVKIPARGHPPESGEWSRATVVEIGVPKPDKFETKGILGLAPAKGDEHTINGKTFLESVTPHGKGGL